jgi:hypothetical protein
MMLHSICRKSIYDPFRMIVHEPEQSLRRVLLGLGLIDFGSQFLLT